MVLATSKRTQDKELPLGAYPVSLSFAVIESEAELCRWHDQQLVGMLVDGVQYQADLRLQFVFGAHLTSLSAGFLSV